MKVPAFCNVNDFYLAICSRGFKADSEELTTLAVEFADCPRLMTPPRHFSAARSSVAAMVIVESESPCERVRSANKDPGVAECSIHNVQ